ncbi:MAG: polysaccharide pyruvyl transferase family protein [Lachnospiraceae bacterium]|nr:polysaccharide pyruvyl transferase family protein [Lachnospiraceae bacterium]
MDKKIVLYGNGSSGNHGCEAIYRGTKEVLDFLMLIQTENAAEDRKYGIDQIAELAPSKSSDVSVIAKAKAYYSLKVKKSFVEMDGIYYLDAIKNASKQANIALSVGGDNYCYGYPEIYAYLNRMYKQFGFKTVLWGCSVEPKLTEDAKVVKDLRNYERIVARESITYDAVKAIGANVIYSPDPAFFMKPEAVDIDERMNKDTIGINCSPMIIRNEKSEGMTYQNYRELIEYILRETDMNVALIPHVVWKQNDDRQVLARLYEECSDKNRIILVEDHSAPQLKHIISKCKVFVGARTHATIAAYSSGIPTLVVGYSVKARGIAKDLMMDQDNYIIPVQDLHNSDQLTKYTVKLLSEYDSVKAQLIRSTAKYNEYRDMVRKEIYSL